MFFVHLLMQDKEHRSAAVSFHADLTHTHTDTSNFPHIYSFMLQHLVFYQQKFPQYNSNSLSE